jgi:acetyl-CoA carboxylase biotin carboxyl carrier protein
MELNHAAVKALLEAFDRSDWQELTVTVGNDRLHVSRQASSNGSSPPPVPATAAEPGAPTQSTEAAAPTVSDAPGPGVVVESPSVGLFWRAPSPGASPFVEVGGRVEAGDAVGIVEVMKLMNHVTAPVAGVVTSILVDNGAAVEYGQPLATIDPDG